MPKPRPQPVSTACADHGQRVDPGLLAARQAAVRQERPAYQRDPQFPHRPAARPAALRPRASHQLRPPGPGCLPPEADRGRHLPQANQPARRPHPPHVQVGRGPGNGPRRRLAGPVCRRRAAGRGSHERQPVKPVSEEHIAAVEPLVTPQIWAMINLQLWTGCRPGEACLIRTIDINTQGEDLGVPAPFPQDRAPRQGAGRLPRSASPGDPQALAEDRPCTPILFSPREGRNGSGRTSEAAQNAATLQSGAASQEGESPASCGGVIYHRRLRICHSPGLCAGWGAVLEPEPTSAYRCHANPGGLWHRGGPHHFGPSFGRNVGDLCGNRPR